MERYVLDDFKIQVTFEQVREKLKLTESEDAETVLPEYTAAMEIARPKAVYRICYVDSIRESGVSIEGICFKSELLAKNLNGLHRVFAYAITCGAEVDAWSRREPDDIMKLWLDIIKEMILRDVREQFFAMLREKYAVEKLSTMNPGSGNADVWPIEQQIPLFELIGDVRRDTGIELCDSMLMLPTKSVSGIAFPSDRGYVNCAYCTRENCTGRRAPYNPAML